MGKGLTGLLVLVILGSLILITSCSKDESKETDFEKLINYVESNNMTLGELLAGWVVSADTSLYADRDNYYFMDLRGGDMNENEIVDFNEGHIEGSVLTSFVTLLEDAAQSQGKPIIVVCYTGQNSGQAVMALRLSGFRDARILKWGISGWHEDFDFWTANTANITHDNWISSPGDLGESKVYDMPDLSAVGGDGAEILAERVAAMLAGGFKGLDRDEVLAAPEDYFINNYWDATDVEYHGNIRTAFRIKPLVLENLAADEIVVTYCWTGQTSAMITAYLNVLGYNAMSLKFGANRIVHDILTSNKWDSSLAANLPYVQ